MSGETSSTYDRLSRWYDWLAGPWEAKAKAEGLRMLSVENGESVAEIGCGTGRTLAAIARAVGVAGHAIGVDLSAGMCAVARYALHRQELLRNTVIVQGDALGLPLATGSLDAVYSSFTVETFADDEIAHVVGECHRALGPAGRICVVAMCSPGAPGLISGAYAWAADRWPSVIDCRPIDAARALEDAGFAVTHSGRTTTARLPVAIVVAGKRPARKQTAADPKGAS